MQYNKETLLGQTLDRKTTPDQRRSAKAKPTHKSLLLVILTG
jgi:hypothetical protein